MALHAAADIEQHGDADPGEIGAEVRNAPSLPAIEHLEVLRLEILDEPSLVVADDRGDPDHVDAALEGCGDRWGLLLLSSNAAEARQNQERPRR